MVANQFGRDAMRQGEKSKLEVQTGSTLQLSFTVIIHEHENVKPDERAALLRELTR